MTNKYLSFVSDEHLMDSVKNFHNSYLEAKKGKTLKDFYKNKIDTIKLTFDSKFNKLNPEALIKSEIIRQIDKSVNNAVGNFHEDVLGGISGFTKGSKSGYDIKSEDNTLFAEIKNKHNTMSSSTAESVFQKLASLADNNKKSKCYWVQILAKKSFNELWKGEINKKEYSHSRVYKISGDQFYKLLTGKDSAFFELTQIIPKVISDYLRNKGELGDDRPNKDSAFEEIILNSQKNSRTILEQMTFDNYSYYLGFNNPEN